MKQYWLNLQPRERHTLLVGGVALVLVLLYGLVIDPFQQELARLETSVEVQTKELAWMRQSSAEVKRLRSGRPATQRMAGQSLMSMVDASARGIGLSGAIKEIKPEGLGVRVRLEQVAFDDLLRWLDQLHGKQGVGVAGLVMERLAQPGRVNASVVLEGVSG